MTNTSKILTLILVTLVAGGFAGIIEFILERYGISSGVFRILLSAVIPAALLVIGYKAGWLPNLRLG